MGVGVGMDVGMGAGRGGRSSMVPSRLPVVEWSENRWAGVAAVRVHAEAGRY